MPGKAPWWPEVSGVTPGGDTWGVWMQEGKAGGMEHQGQGSELFPTAGTRHQPRDVAKGGLQSWLSLGAILTRFVPMLMPPHHT